MSRNTVSLQGKATDSQKVGRDLHVRAILTGGDPNGDESDD